MRISVIIPALNAEKELPGLLKALSEQTLQADEILVTDSESEDRTRQIAEEAGARVIPIRRKDFDHGGTRDMAFRVSTGDIVVFMTQDAVPADEHMLENLIRPLSEEGVAVVCGRQLPKENATRVERLVRTFNYPAESRIRSEADVKTMGIKAFFCSDVCAAYNREIWLELGGFEHPLKTNEDMFFAAKAIRNGYRIAYSADAQIFHSHNFTMKQQYRRNWNQGYEIERHRSLLGEVSQVPEGWKLVRFMSGRLLKQGRIFSFAHFGLDCCARLFGSRAGRKAFLRENKDQGDNA